MKKTLLCFLLLFTNLFFAQVASVSTCGNESFNLTILNADFIGNLNPAQTTVTYFLSEADALNNTNAIANPTTYIGTIGTMKIYGRIDNNGIITTNYFNLTTFPTIVVSASHKPILCKGDTASLSINASGGNGSYSYSLNGGSFTNQDYYPNIAPGVYNIRVMDNIFGCMTSISHTITEPTAVVATSAIVNQNVIIVSATGGTGAYQYSLDGINYQSSNVFTTVAPGNYTVRVRDAEGCGTVVNAIIAPYLVVTAALTQELYCAGNGNNAVITANASGGQLPYYYSIDNGLNYQPYSTFNNLSAGTYSIIVKDALNTVSGPTSVTVPPLIAVTGVALVTGATSCSSASIRVQATSGQGPYLYSIDNGQTFTNNNVFSNLAPGNYVFLIKDSKGCVSAFLSNNVQPPTPPLAIAVTNTPILCWGEKTSLTVTATGGQASYQYSINNGAITSNNVFSDLKTGNYIVKVIDATGCENTLPYTITEPAVVDAEMVIDGNTISIIDAKGGTGSYFYAIDNGNFQTNNVFTNVTPGLHRVRVKDSNNCEPVSFSAEIASPLTSVATIAKEIDCMSDAEIVVTASGGIAPYTYSKNGVTFQTSNVFTNLVAGTYSIIVKDANGTLAIANNLIISPTSYPIIVLTKTNLSCFQANDGIITASVTGGKAPYVYSIGNSYSSANTFTGLAAGFYNVTVKDANGCLSSFAVNIDQPNVIVPTVSTTNSTSIADNDGTITVNATGGVPPYTYALTDENGLPAVFFQTSNIFNGLKSGLYGVQVKDSNGCFTTQTNISIINKTNTLSAAATVTTQPTCNNPYGTITVNATGGTAPYTYSIDNGATYSVSNTFQELPGNYLIKVKDAENSETSITITLIAPAPLVTTAVLTKTIDCLSNGIITVFATGGQAPYLYSFDNGSTYISSNTFSNALAGVYSIIVKDSNNCISNSNSLVVEPLANLSATATNTPILCRYEKGSITIIASGGKAPYQYSLNNDIYTNSNKFDEVLSGNYIIKVKDANDCIFTLPYTIAEPTKIKGYITFEGTTATVVNLSGGSGTYLYSLNDGELQSSNVFTNLHGSNNIISVYDSFGCFGFAVSFSIPDPNALTAQATIIKAIDCTTNSGTISIAASGGQAPYEYSINGGTTYQSSNIFSNLSAGLYTVWVKDAAGTIDYDNSVTLTTPSSVIVDVTTTTTNCFNDNSGSITVTATGGEAPYIYSINNSIYSSNNVFTALSAGQYTINVKDALGCIISSTALVTQPDLLVINNTASNSTNVNSNDGKITVTPSGGTAPYLYSLKNANGSLIISPQSSNIFDNLSIGQYTIEVKDANGCITSKSGITITSQTLFGTLMITPITCTALGTIIINAAGGKYPHQYSFDGGITYGTSNIASNLSAGTYTIKVKDASDATITLSASLAPVSPVVVTASITSPVYCKGSNNAAIQVIASGGKAPYIYSLNGSAYQSNNSFFNLSAGNYVVTVKDSNNCSSTMIVTITEPNALAVTTTVQNQNITVNATGGNGGYRYAISPNLNQFSSNNTFSNLSPGSYSIITSDLYGCVVIINAVVDPVAPTVNGQSNLTVEFKEGQTLADLIVEGEDIKWYSTPNSSAGKTSKTNETPLPLTTVLVNGTTYYASQTINGIESKERLAVTAKVNGSLSAPDFNLVSFQFYPNPVKDILTIKNNSIINDIEIISVSGTSVLFKTINDIHSEIDFSNLSSGLYLLKVKSENQQKTIKLIKR
ncbi:T9SS type A sorting domain-containing protein [Flavobacterium ginsenosidimutans]|uniref:T9SS type A sorting domain-containing protein n=1 Tax=Flavobacterium ginsenosidimutans TaxID=687844 RepID=UPI000DAF424E|nr:T9SS type A sorting domain-containing protein [Flavobacterium ginsenosidimutans]KAF2332296.1 T9SS type A sorting domain-containing protein [Flavobacterium ginsenosidimutans]